MKVRITAAMATKDPPADTRLPIPAGIGRTTQPAPTYSVVVELDCCSYEQAVFLTGLGRNGGHVNITEDNS